MIASMLKRTLNITNNIYFHIITKYAQTFARIAENLLKRLKFRRDYLLITGEKRVCSIGGREKRRMKVSDCEKYCEQYQRKTWTQYYEPKNYHAIGFTHAYGFCRKNNCRCAEVKKCSMIERNKQ